MSTATTGIQNLTPVVKASAAEVTAGTNDTKFVTPLTSQGIRNLRQYNGLGVDFTVTGNNGWVTRTADAIPYQTIDGTWRLQLNLVGTSTFTSAVIAITISGISFKNDIGSLMSGRHFTGGATGHHGFHTPVSNTGNINLIQTDGARDTVSLFFDNKLNSKPTWAL